MLAFCSEIPGHKMANLVEQGRTPLLPPARLTEIGYKIAAYPITLLSAAVHAMIEALAALKDGQPPARLMPFAALQEILGFADYFAEEQRYHCPGNVTDKDSDRGQG